MLELMTEQIPYPNVIKCSFWNISVMKELKFRYSCDIFIPKVNFADSGADVETFVRFI